MRFKQTKSIFKIYAVTGTNTIAFGIDCDDAAAKGLLGFTVEKEYTTAQNKHVRVTVMGFKVFRERVPHPIPGALYSTWDNPIQAFTWEDFTAYPDSVYNYHFTPLYDDPMNIRRGDICSIEVRTEATWKKGDHSIFFNRGVASSQAYAMKFGNKPPDQVAGDKAYKWLSRGLKEAIIAFIDEAKKGDAIYGCFYEFRYDGVLQALHEAAERGVELHLVYDAKENGTATTPSFPKVDNERAMEIAGLKVGHGIEIFPRKRNKSYISHNKFMVIERNGTPIKVWTGSTNISKGGIFGQANVGHSVDNAAVASMYRKYWEAIKPDPESKAFKKGNESFQANIVKAEDIPTGSTCIFSPRTSLAMLDFYASLLDSAKDCACITLAFGIADVFRKALSDNTADSALTFLLMETDEAGVFDYVQKNNVVKAVGSAMPENALYRWVKETNTGALQINQHVKYIHTKFMLVDPLGDNPVVVSGSANFSAASTTENDENMLIVKGNKRVADIYFTEYMRLFNHYYFRWVMKKMQAAGTLDPDSPGFLTPNDTWTQAYRKGNLKRKRVDLFVKMKS